MFRAQNQRARRGPLKPDYVFIARDSLFKSANKSRSRSGRSRGSIISPLTNLRHFKVTRYRPFRFSATAARASQTSRLRSPRASIRRQGSEASDIPRSEYKQTPGPAASDIPHSSARSDSTWEEDEQRRPEKEDFLKMRRGGDETNRDRKGDYWGYLRQQRRRQKEYYSRLSTAKWYARQPPKVQAEYDQEQASRHRTGTHSNEGKWRKGYKRSQYSTEGKWSKGRKRSQHSTEDTWRQGSERSRQRNESKRNQKRNEGNGRNKKTKFSSSPRRPHRATQPQDPVSERVHTTFSNRWSVLPECSC